MDIKTAEKMGYKKTIYNGYYINKNAKVLNLRKAKNIKLNCTKLIDRDGYERIWVKTDNGRKFVPVHRLLAYAFIPKPRNKNIINHKDGNKSNNTLKNIEWCTYRENELHARRVLGKKSPCGERCGSSKLKIKDVLFIRKSKAKPKDLAPKFNIKANQIYRIRAYVDWKNV